MKRRTTLPLRKTSRIRVRLTFRLLLGVLPDLGFLDPGADDQADQGRDDAQAEQPPPGQPEHTVDEEEGDGRQQIAAGVAGLEQPGEEAASLSRDLLHCQGGAEAPFAAHPDAVQQSQDDQHRQVRCERAAEADHRVEADVDHQRDPTSEPVGQQTEDQRTHRTHQQGGGGEQGHLGLAVAERLGDVGVDEDHDEVVEGVHRPAQLGGQEGVALISVERCALLRC